MSGVYAKKRFTADYPCVICGGHKELPQGIGERCAGYTFESEGRKFAVCTREEYANGITERPGVGFTHSLFGKCRCGVEHGENTPEMQDDEQPEPQPNRSRGRPRKEDH